MQQLVVQHLVGVITGTISGSELDKGRVAIGQAYAAVLADASLDDLMRGELVIMPGETYLAEQLLVNEPAKVHESREALKGWLGDSLKTQWLALHDRCVAVPYSLSAEARGARKLKTQALVYLAPADRTEAARRAKAQFEAADNMTDRQGALMVLCGLDVPEREEALAAFHERFAGNALVIDKWFSLQAGSLHPEALEHVKALRGHPDFTLANPNRVRALYMAFAGNPQAFHAASGEGYRLIADLILELDPLNPNTAARFVPPLGRWKRMEPGRAALMKAELVRLAAEPKLSRDTREQVTRSLEG
jgi:aminopeptidase N